MKVFLIEKERLILVATIKDSNQKKILAQRKYIKKRGKDIFFYNRQLLPIIREFLREE